jgi:RND family efflux transporter MFP subunit
MTAMTTIAETGAQGCRTGLLLVLLGAPAGCGSPLPEAPRAEAENWSVTAWGTRYEIFPEVEPLVAGETAVAHTHVTRLEGFAPLVEGEVEIVLSGPSGEQVFVAKRPVRPGIFAVEIEPGSPGTFDLAFRIRGPEGPEAIAGGQVRVGPAEEPGGLVSSPAVPPGSDGGEPLTFLKEQQWRTDFATAWVAAGELARSTSGLARVRPPAGGETSLTSPVGGVLRPASRVWPFVGLRVDRGNALFLVVPHVAAERSLATLEAELATLAAELETARARLSRLEELLALEATSGREVEDARVRVETLTARHAAAASDLGAARSSREGGSSGGLTLRAPFAGEIAQVVSSPGTTVAAGDPLARLVRTDVAWLEVAVPSAAARRLGAEGVRGVVLSEPERGPVRIEDGLRMISIAPEVSPSTGTVAVLLEVPASADLVLGTTLEAQILSEERREGVVIPTSALVDDGGVPVVYLQLSGESFVRQEVHVLERQGDLLLVEHLAPGQRLVTRGGDAIRRSSLMSSGEVKGHVH